MGLFRKKDNNEGIIIRSNKTKNVIIKDIRGNIKYICKVPDFVADNLAIKMAKDACGDNASSDTITIEEE